MKDIVSIKYPNNKPQVMTEKDLMTFGLVVVCKEPKSIFGYSLIWCVNAYGIHTTHFIKQQSP